MSAAAQNPAPTPGASAARKKGAAVRLGEHLIEQGLITRDQLRVALTEQKLRKWPLGKILVHLELVSESVMRDALAELHGENSIDLSALVADPAAIAMIPHDFARRYKVLPVAWSPEQRTLQLAMTDTHDVVALDQVSALLGSDVEIDPLLGGETEIDQAIHQLYGFEYSLDGILTEIETGDVESLSQTVSHGTEYSHPLVRLVDALLADAVKLEASDIHFEPEAGFIRVRLRIDGVLRQLHTLHKSLLSGIIVRLKVMSGMDIAETRAPQDGRISLNLLGRTVDFRVASQPTTYGENMVLRVLDRQRGIIPFNRMDLFDDVRKTISIMMARPEGIILVTGPTGSGKTTTLYSMLSHCNHESVNIMTLEDPVEYPMAMIRQSQVNESARMDFANGIRSLMRPDPDIILVGEIRDADTAEMAFRAAMTGHQVFSTLHTNSALGAIPRLLDIGVKPHILAGNMIGIVAQRLIRRLCGECREAYEPDRVERELIGVDVIDHLYRAVGCSACGGSGYRGRMPLIEVLKFDRHLDDMIAQGATQLQMHQAVEAKGFRDLAYYGVQRLLAGQTSLDEVSRVVDLTDRV